jgi:hypothetical protein
MTSPLWVEINQVIAKSANRNTLELDGSSLKTTLKNSLKTIIKCGIYETSKMNDIIILR